MKHLQKLPATLFGLALLTSSSLRAEDLPDPDGKPADMSKPVQVFIVMGQSNTLEMGKVTDELKTAYPFLADDSGNWTVRQDVRNVSVMQKGANANIYRNDWLAVNPNKIGIEIGIGSVLGDAVDAPVMVLKSSIGNRGLGWDLLPPGSERYDFADPKDGKTYVYPGYKDEVRHGRWEKGNVPEEPKHNWYAGKQYDDDVANAKKILSELDKYYPDAKSYEVAGFLWWQGDKDMRDPGHAARYETNLVTLIKALRKDFDAPKAPFVTASLGQTEESDTESGHGVILHAMKNVASGKYSAELGDNIGFVYTHPLSEGSSSSAHYGGNAKTYMNVGLGMGKAMKDLLKK